MTKEKKETFLLRTQLILVGSMAGAAMAGKLDVDHMATLIADLIMPKIEEELDNALKE